MPNSLVSKWIHPLEKYCMLGDSLMGCLGLGLLTFLGTAFGVNLSTISLLYLLLVVTVAVSSGFWAASITSLVAVAGLDYYFTQPVFTFNISDPQDWVALAAFEVTALMVSRLSAKELRNARESALHRAGMEQLYELSRSLLLLDLRQAPGGQLVLLIQRIFRTNAVAIFDNNLTRQDRVGNWKAGDEDAAKECFQQGAAPTDSDGQTSRRILRVGAESRGALVIRGSLNPLVIDGLASLAAIAMERSQSFENEERAETATRGEQLRAAVMDALAHEFKTPLTAVHTAGAGLLELGGLTESQRDLVTLMDDEAVRLNELCTRLLLTAKLEGGQVGLQRDDVNVLELVLEILARRPGSVDRGRIKVAVDDPALSVRVDRELLAMILAEFIENACKYSTPHTPIEIAARMSHTEVIIFIHNFGSTIRIEDRQRVFDRFYRSPDSKASVSGTGIGLSVVKKAAEAHHGHVWVVSDESEGTTFFLTLPTSARRAH